MYDHLGLKVKNLDASVGFYGAALAPLGHVLASRDQTSAGFGPPGEPALWLYLANGAAGPGMHVALRAADRAAVDRFHADGVAGGGRDHRRPGVRRGNSPRHYAPFLTGSGGHNVVAGSPAL